MANKCVVLDTPINISPTTGDSDKDEFSELVRRRPHEAKMVVLLYIVVEWIKLAFHSARFPHQNLVLIPKLAFTVIYSSLLLVVMLHR